MQTTPYQRPPWFFWLALLFFVCMVLLASHRLLIQLTSADQQPGHLWVAAVAGIDVGIYRHVARVGEAGSIEIWYTSDDLHTIVRIPGTPALPPPRRLHVRVELDA